MAVAQPGARGYIDRPRPSGLADVIEVILDKGIVIDAYVRVSLIGIEILTIDARIVIASVDTYLRFAEAVEPPRHRPRRRLAGPARAHGVDDRGRREVEDAGRARGRQGEAHRRRRRRRRQEGEEPQSRRRSLVERIVALAVAPEQGQLVTDPHFGTVYVYGVLRGRRRGQRWPCRASRTRRCATVEHDGLAALVAISRATRSPPPARSARTGACSRRRRSTRPSAGALRHRHGERAAVRERAARAERRRARRPPAAARRPGPAERQGRLRRGAPAARGRPARAGDRRRCTRRVSELPRRAAYYERIRLGELVAAEVERRREADTASALERLEPLAVGARGRAGRRAGRRVQPRLPGRARPGRRRSARRSPSSDEASATASAPLRRPAAALQLHRGRPDRGEPRMGLITGLLTLPLAPVRGHGVARRAHPGAGRGRAVRRDRDPRGPARARAGAREAGEIDEEEIAAAEDALIERLMAMRGFEEEGAWQGRDDDGRLSAVELGEAALSDGRGADRATSPRRSPGWSGTASSGRSRLTCSSSSGSRTPPM